MMVLSPICDFLDSYAEKLMVLEVVVSKDIDDSMCLSNHMSHNILIVGS